MFPSEFWRSAYLPHLCRCEGSRPPLVSTAGHGGSFGSARSSGLLCCVCTHSDRGSEHSKMKGDMVSMGSANEKAVIYCAAVDYFKQEDHFPFSFSLTKDMLIITDSVSFWPYHPLTDHADLPGVDPRHRSALWSMSVTEAAPSHYQLIDSVVIFLQDFRASVQKVISQSVELCEVNAQVGDAQKICKGNVF